MLGKLLSYGSGAEDSQLSSALFYKYVAGRMDMMDAAATNRNDGLYRWLALAARSRVFDMMGRLRTDLSGSLRYI